MDITKIVTQKGKQVLEVLQSAEFIDDFYLAGGTGLALQLFHRRSVDFDFFSQKNTLYTQQRNEIKRYLRQKGNIKIIQDKDNTLDLLFNSIQLSFFYYNFTLVKPLVKINKINVASIEDIGLMKLSSIISRGSKKDFIDLYFICQKIPLKELVKYSKKKYKEFYDFISVAVKSLTYFFDAEDEKMPLMLKKISWQEIKNFFIKETKNLIKEEI
ncbi:MAG: nucleotidyl transferase AbiEii/AbiGii toxin family protein [Endomicrobia bacterium]|nr:nucleotidyl transferase AbiEii/AbiGii toxin family protein [Endomicrobiia bacterium]MDW8055342.1 nucleotidyl transferase AbiEii/AbiGii toxin family protein [Elusimicrobiota bacterium]